MNPKCTLLICALAMLIASCGSLQGFEKRRYMKGFYVSVTDNKPQTELLSNNKEEVTAEKEEEKICADTVPEKKDSAQVLVISNKVGNTIDSAEKAKYKLFPYWDNKDFVSAQFIQEPDLEIYVVGKMKDGTIKKMPYSKSSYEQLGKFTFGEVPNDAEYTKSDLEKTKQNKDAKKTTVGLGLVGLSTIVVILIILLIAAITAAILGALGALILLFFL